MKYALLFILPVVVVSLLYLKGSPTRKNIHIVEVPTPPVTAAIVAPAMIPEPIKEIPKGPLETNKDYIYVNRDAMEITLYRDNVEYKKFPVLSIRRIGSKFDTPTGQFEILSKEPNHFSSIGHVWMPYSMQFHGDFFIHGWPYYPDGTPVAKGYSGGCVRLSDEVSKEVYGFAVLGMPVLIE